ncbi:hypothetical protein SBA5_80022 [Candidatus Sulfotelmatomonas gaucii]|uniref:Uncharacterized protein n=1 Tax=Candidatus Sulfuritelmatomonas gaucii TaxID=2043161 RepID=A0A2N9M5A7_9BACT|nr:hypothetical protein SBA5_80022 [Candidatus Sulfotelmatomonas gaucii]
MVVQRHAAVPPRRAPQGIPRLGRQFSSHAHGIEVVLTLAGWKQCVALQLLDRTHCGGGCLSIVALLFVQLFGAGAVTCPESCGMFANMVR